ncbi:uncharacterized protein LOC101864442 [Aplysia californica]|uniref:Uncharacterized protein LOC101864442 n=1 Tax=Aplysia californica TaxID=6500 RepID=A0ABM0ZV03_APLCA|nr:uncharacterized protein LOC101864442 [Aplysia californica]
MPFWENVSSTTSTKDGIPLPGLIGDGAAKIILVVHLVVMGQIVSVFGIIANTINIVVFFKQGFNESTTISLFALAVGDLCALLILQWFTLCINPWFSQLPLSFSPLEIQSLTAGYPRICFVRITGWITAFVAFERCLSVVVPLKVKSIITTRVAALVNILVFFFSFCSMVPVYSTAYYDWKFYPQQNRSLMGIFFTTNKDAVLGVSLFITDFFGPLTSFTIVIICTCVISLELRKKAKWRHHTSSKAIISGQKNFGKENRVVIMVTIISILFIVSATPMTASLTARALIPELNIIGRYKNLSWLSASVSFLMETVNSSVNIFVYYRMSTKWVRHLNNGPEEEDEESSTSSSDRSRLGRPPSRVNITNKKEARKQR